MLAGSLSETGAVTLLLPPPLFLFLFFLNIHPVCFCYPYYAYVCLVGFAFYSFASFSSYLPSLSSLSVCVRVCGRTSKGVILCSFQFSSSYHNEQQFLVFI